MCDIDKAIEQYKDYQESGWSKSEVPNSYYLMLAIAALKEKQARENPKPLTLEQLKQREGKPVWVVVNSDLPNRWGLVDWINNKIIMAGSYFVRPNEVEEGKIKVFEHEPKGV
jgi:acyl-CoA reductase-like NAD-dependent aldehyde dehydrogenase